MEMKVAFLVLAHRAPAYIRRLVDVLSEQGDTIFIHIDKTVDISSFEKTLSSQHSTHLISNRYPITWGGFNMIRATNALLESAVTWGSFDYFYLLSGQCFPIKSLPWLKQVLSGGLDHIDCQPMPQLSKPLTRLTKRVLNDVKSRALRRLGGKILNLMPVADIQVSLGLLPYAGSQWWCLNRDTVEYIREYLQAHPEYDKFMRWTHVPDEMYCQTLVANGPNSGRISNSLTGTIWVDGERSPEIITSSNVSKLLCQKVFLGRKFETDDFALLDIVRDIVTGATAIVH